MQLLLFIKLQEDFTLQINQRGFRVLFKKNNNEAMRQHRRKHKRCNEVKKAGEGFKPTERLSIFLHSELHRPSES